MVREKDIETDRQIGIYSYNFGADLVFIFVELVRV